MNTTKLKALVDQATPEERLFLEQYLAHLQRSEDPRYAEELAGRHRDMDAGQKVTLAQATRLHEALEKQGL